jgi:rhodanese-related sulfurtransferase
LRWWRAGKGIYGDRGSALISDLKPVILEVRTPGEFAGGPIGGATLIPVQDSQRRVGELLHGELNLASQKGPVKTERGTGQIDRAGVQFAQFVCPGAVAGADGANDDGDAGVALLRARRADEQDPEVAGEEPVVTARPIASPNSRTSRRSRKSVTSRLPARSSRALFRWMQKPISR